MEVYPQKWTSFLASHFASIGFYASEGEECCAVVIANKLKEEKKKKKAFLGLIAGDINAIEYFIESLKDSKFHKIKSYKGFIFIIGQFKPKIWRKNILYLGSILLIKIINKIVA